MNDVVTVTDESVETQVYAKLVEMGKPAKSGNSALDKAKTTLQGAYNLGMDAAVMAGSWEVFEPIISQLESNIRKNVDGLAVTFGAEKREKPDKKGNKYKVPFSVSTVKSRVKKAYEHGVILTEGEDLHARSYNSVKEEIQAIEDVAKTEAKAKATAELTGEDKTRHEISVFCGEIVKASQEWTGATLADVHRALGTLAGHNMTSTGEELEETASEAGSETPEAKTA